MNRDSLIELLEDQLLPSFKNEREKLDVIDEWLRTTADSIQTKKSKDKEYKYLKTIARTPWAQTIIRTAAQGLQVEGIFSRTRSTEELIRSWIPWERNDMARKAPALHRAAMGYGQAFTLVLPGEPNAVINAYSPREALAFYGDAVEDEFPMHFLRVIPQPGKSFHYRIVDEGSVHYLSRETPTSKAEFLETKVHNMGVTPVVRYANEIDLEGRTPGEIEPLIPLFSRIAKTDYDRLLAQHFNSWKVRTATGLDDTDKNESDRERTKLKLANDDILVGGEGVSFDTLDETQLEGFIKAKDSDIESLAATSQSPVTAFGKLANISAEGLQEARASLRMKVNERKETFGASHSLTLRLCAYAEGRDEDSRDYSLRTKWADNEALYLAQAVDALGKAATMLNVPAELLWDRLPGVDLDTAEQWKKHAKENPSADERIAAAAERAMNPTV